MAKLSTAFKVEIVGFDDAYFAPTIADLINGNETDKRFHNYFRVATHERTRRSSVLRVVGNNHELYKITIEKEENESDD